MTTPDDVLLARAYLSRVAEPANLALWAFVQSEGPVEAVAAIRADRAPQPVRAACEARRADVDPDADLAAAEHKNIRLVVPESPDWPHFAIGALARAAEALIAEGRRRRPVAQSGRPERDSGDPVPPLALWVRGAADVASLGARSAGLVGARAATRYGEQVASDFSYGLARAGVTVVSGGAYGIDAAAHRGALAAGGSTVIVSAGGLDRPYPASNAALYDRAVDTGLLVSESPPGAAPHRRRFLTRNRLIAALSSATVVVEAATRSGAANTAAHCFALGKPVLAVPGPITSPMSAGCHALLRRSPEPALLATCVDDVLGAVGGIGERTDGALGAPHPVEDARMERRRRLDALDPLARRIFDGMAVRTWLRPDQIARRSGVPPVEVIRALPALDLAGLVDESDLGYRVRPVRGVGAHTRVQ